LRVPRRLFFDAFSSREPVPTSLENALSGTDDRNRGRIEVPPSVQNRLGTKIAHTENEDDVLERFDLTAPTVRGSTSRCRFGHDSAIPDISASSSNDYQ
jgi:hypothetical protein